MKRIACVLLLLLLFASIALAEFTKLVSVTGGSAQLFSTSLSAAGYTGPTQLDELTICNPGASTVYLGSVSNVNATTGFPIELGGCITFRAAARPVEIGGLYLFVATTQNIAVTLRPR